MRASDLPNVAWRVFAIAGLLLAIVNLALPGSAENFCYDVAGLASVGAILLGLRLNRPSRCAPIPTSPRS